MQAIFYFVYILSLIFAALSQDSNSNKYSASTTSFEQYLAPFRFYSQQHPSSEVSRRLHDIRSGLYKIIHLINPLTYLRSNNTEELTSSNLIEKNASIFSKIQEKPLDNLETKNLNSQNNHSNLEDRNINYVPFNDNIINGKESVKTSINSVANYLPRIRPPSEITLPRFLPSKNKVIQSADFDRNIPYSNYNTDIAHNYKSLAALNFNVSPFLTRRTRSVNPGPQFTKQPIIVSPYLSHATNYRSQPSSGNHNYYSQNYNSNHGLPYHVSMVQPMVRKRGLYLRPYDPCYNQNKEDYKESIQTQYSRGQDNPRIDKRGYYLRPYSRC